MSEVEVDAREYVPIDRWRRRGRIGAIRKRVRRLAVGSGAVFLALTLASPDGELSLLVGAVRLLSLVTGISAWSVNEALGEADDDGDGSVLAAVGVVVLVGLAWGAEHSAAGALLRRLVLGEVASVAGTDVDAASTARVTTEDDPTATAAADSDASDGSRPVGTYLGLVTVLLVGGAVSLLALPRAGGIDPGSVGVFLLLTAVIGGVVGLFAGLSIR
jgi:hypothetical protein